VGERDKVCLSASDRPKPARRHKPRLSVKEKTPAGDAGVFRPKRSALGEIDRLKPNTVRLSHAEWNELVGLIKRGELGEIEER
jgi:hypothetical protein